jgi:hypothetical protein
MGTWSVAFIPVVCQIQKLVHDKDVDAMLLFMNGEARFHHSGFVTAQNKSLRHKIRCTVYEGLLYCMKVVEGE